MYPHFHFRALGISAAVSLVSLGWAMASYSHALRQAHRDDYRVHWDSMLLHTLWHLALIAARVSAIVAFTSTYKGWIFVIIGECHRKIEES